jgi:tetratricopeptide (TPR) repeat protein
MGWRLFPEAVHLPVQLAVALSDQARLPEALDILDEVPIDDRIPDDLQVFLFGMRANLLGSMGRWAEAEEALREGLGCHPKSSLLSEARDGLQSARLKLRAEKALADSWRESLAELDGVAAEIDDAIIRCGEVNELAELVTIAARRLWRAYTDEARPRPHSPDPWGTALVFAVLEIDGENPSIAAAARSMRCSPSSVRSILKRLRSYLSSLDSEFRTRAFAGTTNPRLQEELVAPHRRLQDTNVVPFPTR